MCNTINKFPACHLAEVDFAPIVVWDTWWLVFWCSTIESIGRDLGQQLNYTNTADMTEHLFCRNVGLWDGLWISFVSFLRYPKWFQNIHASKKILHVVILVVTVRHGCWGVPHYYLQSKVSLRQTTRRREILTLLYHERARNRCADASEVPRGIARRSQRLASETAEEWETRLSQRRVQDWTSQEAMCSLQVRWRAGNALVPTPSAGPEAESSFWNSWRGWSNTGSCAQPYPSWVAPAREQCLTFY